MAFVDGDKATCEPRDFLCSPNVRIIVATSPKGAHQGWVKQASNHTVFITLVTSLWSLDEVFLTWIFLHPRDVTFKLLKESTSYFGYNPRRCFDASSSMTQLATKKREVLKRIGDVGEVRIPSPTTFFKFTQTQTMDPDDSKIATLKLFRDGFLLLY